MSENSPQPTSHEGAKLAPWLKGAAAAGGIAVGGAFGLAEMPATAEAHTPAPVAHHLEFGAPVVDFGGQVPTAKDLLAMHGSRKAKTAAEAPLAVAASNEFRSNEPMPKSVEKLITHNSAWIDALKCSAWLLRDKKDNVVGAELVAHCGVLPNQAVRYRGPDGKIYMIAKKPLELKIGSHYNKKVGVIDKIAAPNDYDTETIIAATKGHSIKEARRIAQSQKMTKSEMAEFRVGDPLYSAGRPLDPNGKGSRLGTVGRVMGFGRGDTNAGTHVKNTLWVSNTSGKDGGEPGPGYSGSGAIAPVKSSGELKVVGNVYGFDDLTGNVLIGPSESGTIKLPGAITSVSAIDTGGPRSSEHTTLLHVAHSKDEFLGTSAEQTAIDKAKRAFEDPNAFKLIVNGDTYIGDSHQWVEGVTIVNDSNNYNVVALWENPNKPGELNAKYFDYDPANPDKRDRMQLSVYPRAGHDTAGTNIAQGAPQWDATSQAFKLNIDGEDRLIGEVLPSAPDTTKPEYLLSIDSDGIIGVRQFENP